MKTYHDSRTILLDFDKHYAPRLSPLFAVLHIIGLRARWIHYERTRRGWHVRIRLEYPLLPAETVALQFALGSDKRRETLNLMRVFWLARKEHKAKWSKRWNILYERKVTQ